MSKTPNDIKQFDLELYKKVSFAVTANGANILEDFIIIFQFNNRRFPDVLYDLDLIVIIYRRTWDYSALPLRLPLLYIKTINIRLQSMLLTKFPIFLLGTILRNFNINPLLQIESIIQYKNHRGPAIPSVIDLIATLSSLILLTH